MAGRSSTLLALLGMIVAIGCAPAAPREAASGDGSAPASPPSNRTLRIVTRVEPVSIASKNPDLGLNKAAPLGVIDSIEAPDARTVLIKWLKPYADAGILGTNLPALPRHILKAAYDTGDAQGFAANPYWTSQFVGLGPFRLTH